MRYIQITLFGLLLFVPFLGQVHLFDWDEINFAECAREMLVSKDYLRMQIDFQPFYEKPPLFIWMQVLSMQLFGVNDFAARFPNAMVGVTTLLALYYVGKRTVHERLGLIWVLLYAATWLPHFYFKSGIIDPLFNLLIFLAFFQVYIIPHSSKPVKHVLFAGVFLGLAVLTKGPVALIVSGISLFVYILLQRGVKPYKWSHFIGIALCALMVTSLWFGVELLKNGSKFLEEFLAYQAGLFSQNIADHAEPWYYHPVVLMIGCFPAVQFLFQYRKGSGTEILHVSSGFSRWMWILFWVVLTLFSIVKTKIVHYSSLCYFPITYLAALQIYRLAEEKVRLKSIVRFLLIFIGVIWGIVLMAIPLAGIHKSSLIPYIQDPFAVANLSAEVPWTYAEVGIGLVYFVVLLVLLTRLRTHFRQSIIALLALQLIAIQITILHFTPKIEAYSQRAAIEFYESKQGQDVYVHVLGFRSYAYLFYTRKQPSTNPEYYNEQWLLSGPVDKPCFFVTKIQDADQYKRLETLEYLYEKNGFVFFQRTR